MSLATTSSSVAGAAARQPIHSLYVLKALLAFVVCMAHSPMTLPWVSLPGASVDVFFIISGYFLYSSDLERVWASIRKSSRKILIAILILQPFYSLYMRELGLIRLEQFPPLESPMPWVLWLVQGYSPIASGHLWFLQALLYSLLSFGLFLRLTKGRWVPLLFPLLIGMGLLGPFREFFFGKETSIFIFNFLTRALPSLALGYWAHQHQGSLLRHSWLTIFVLGLILSGLEMLLWRFGAGWAGGSSWIYLLFMPFALFMLFLQYPDFGKGSWPAAVGMYYAGNIYYFHKVYFLLWEHFNPQYPLLEQIYQQAGGLIVFLLSVPTAWAIIKLQDRLGWNLLR